MDARGEQDRGELEIVWGAASIGRVIGKTPSQTFYLLRKKRIKAAKKIGDQHCADVAGLRAQFCSIGAAA